MAAHSALSPFANLPLVVILSMPQLARLSLRRRSHPRFGDRLSNSVVSMWRYARHTLPPRLRGSIGGILYYVVDHVLQRRRSPISYWVRSVIGPTPRHAQSSETPKTGQCGYAGYVTGFGHRIELAMGYLKENCVQTSACSCPARNGWMGKGQDQRRPISHGLVSPSLTMSRQKESPASTRFQMNW